MQEVGKVIIERPNFGQIASNRRSLVDAMEPMDEFDIAKGHIDAEKAKRRGRS